MKLTKQKINTLLLSLAVFIIIYLVVGMWMWGSRPEAFRGSSTNYVTTWINSWMPAREGLAFLSDYEYPTGTPFTTTNPTGTTVPTIFTDQQTQKLRQVFDYIDTDGDGKLNVAETEVALREMYSTNPSVTIDHASVVSMFTMFDTNRTGFIEFDEFQAIAKKLMSANDLQNFANQTIPTRYRATTNPTGTPFTTNPTGTPFTTGPTGTTLFTEQQTQKLRQFFDYIDIDGDGKISVAETIALVREILSPMTIDEKGVAELVAYIDTNKSGVVEFDEFLVFMKWFLTEQDLQDLVNETIPTRYRPTKTPTISITTPPVVCTAATRTPLDVLNPLNIVGNQQATVRAFYIQTIEGKPIPSVFYSPLDLKKYTVNVSNIGFMVQGSGFCSADIVISGGEYTTSKYLGVSILNGRAVNTQQYAGLSEFTSQPSPTPDALAQCPGYVPTPGATPMPSKPPHCYRVGHLSQSNTVQWVNSQEYIVKDLQSEDPYANTLRRGLYGDVILREDISFNQDVQYYFTLLLFDDDGKIIRPTCNNNVVTFAPAYTMNPSYVPDFTFAYHHYMVGGGGGGGQACGRDVLSAGCSGADGKPGDVRAANMYMNYSINGAYKYTATSRAQPPPLVKYSHTSMGGITGGKGGAGSHFGEVGNSGQKGTEVSYGFMDIRQTCTGGEGGAGANGFEPTADDWSATPTPPMGMTTPTPTSGVFTDIAPFQGLVSTLNPDTGKGGRGGKTTNNMNTYGMDGYNGYMYMGMYHFGIGGGTQPLTTPPPTICPCSPTAIATCSASVATPAVYNVEGDNHVVLTMKYQALPAASVKFNEVLSSTDILVFYYKSASSYRVTMQCNRRNTIPRALRNPNPIATQYDSYKSWKWVVQMSGAVDGTTALEINNDLNSYRLTDLGAQGVHLGGPGAAFVSNPSMFPASHQIAYYYVSSPTAGQTPGPTGQTTGPTGFTTSPTGQTTGPTGFTTGPTWFTTNPTGQTTGPTGQTTSSGGIWVPVHVLQYYFDDTETTVLTDLGVLYLYIDLGGVIHGIYSQPSRTGTQYTAPDGDPRKNALLTSMQPIAKAGRNVYYHIYLFYTNDQITYDTA